MEPTEIQIVRSNRARRIIISINGSGQVRLTYPAGVSERRALEFLDSRREWVERTAARMRERSRHKETLSPERIEALRVQAKAVLPLRLAQLAEQHGFRYNRVTIRAARTKWGCCTSQNNISLSLFLMTLPEHLRDFVLLHELCHTVHHDHSTAFHVLLDGCLGGRERELRRELRQYGTM